MIQIQSNQEEYAIEFISCNCRDKIDFLIFFSCVCGFFFSQCLLQLLIMKED